MLSTVRDGSFLVAHLVVALSMPKRDTERGLQGEGYERIDCVLDCGRFAPLM